VSAGGFPRVCIIGVGLIGGSFAAALKRMDDAPVVLGIDTDQSSLGFALETGILDEGAAPGSAEASRWLGSASAGGADLVVIATPARHAVEWLAAIGARDFDGIVTDVASTKAGVLAAADSLLGDQARFVGGHPMAGSERSGVTAAKAELFDNAYWILTPADSTDADAFRRVHALVSAVGARVVSVDASAHDEAVAIVSHVPHVAAAALCDVAAAHAGENNELLRLAAGGFKDTTRIAAGSPDLWTGICLDNAEALASGLAELRETLRAFEVRVRTRDASAIREWLASAADVRTSLPAQWVPATTDLTELVVPMLDRPGVVAEITGAVSRAGGNIEGIDIDHETESRALLVLVLTDEGDHAKLAEDIVALGYEPRLRPLSESGTDR
jgi:prephenate dehydrogenase